MSDDGREDAIKVAPVIIVTMPILMLRVVLAYMKIKRSARRAVKDFKRGVKSEGLPPEIAKSLWKTYDENTSLFRQVASSGMRGFMFAPK
jgi:hypothetical protein